MRRFGWVCILSVIFAAPALAQDLVVHEWGTLTSLQDDDGRTLGGINSDDEPVPPFCHSLRWDLILGNPSQGVPRCHPDVTMRLETPVLYFHPARGARTPLTLDVMATFNGGWLTQFYPDAEVDAPGYSGTGSSPGHISAETIGTLTWKNISVGAEGTLVDSNDHVWITPRRVDAANVTVTNSNGQRETERYLFYRGVGHLEAPVVATQKSGQITLRMRAKESGSMCVSRSWVASFGADGSCMAEAIGRIGDSKEIGIAIPSVAAPLDLKHLRAEMKRALIEDGGLFEDEAEAMLATWELSYFKSAGLRVFYIVPDEWIDAHLPLKLSVPARVKRLMIGRLELITSRQRQLLRQIADTQIPTARMQPRDAAARAYEQLGRFRNALLLDEVEQRPTASLRQFISLNELQPFAAPRQ